MNTRKTERDLGVPPASPFCCSVSGHHTGSLEPLGCPAPMSLFFSPPGQPGSLYSTTWFVEIISKVGGELLCRLALSFFISFFFHSSEKLWPVQALQPVGWVETSVLIVPILAQNPDHAHPCSKPFRDPPPLLLESGQVPTVGHKALPDPALPAPSSVAFLPVGFASFLFPHILFPFPLPPLLPSCIRAAADPPDTCHPSLGPLLAHPLFTEIVPDCKIAFPPILSLTPTLG